jgi:hypothetical protein
MERRQGGQGPAVNLAKQKRRPERSRPGLKALTPAERKVVEERLADHKKRWEYLFSINLWKPVK